MHGGAARWTFAYPGGEPVLEHVDFHAAPGEVVALTGPSGEGKTTMIRLMLGLIRPAQGSVSLTGADGQCVPASAATRAAFSYVPQGNTVFAGTIADNLRMVRPEATDAELVSALETACAYDFVSQLPDGIYARTGELGHGLSEGQAQRIAVARAVLRGTQVLLLDEATSALDETTGAADARKPHVQRPRADVRAHHAPRCDSRTLRPPLCPARHAPVRAERAVTAMGKIGKCWRGNRGGYL